MYIYIYVKALDLEADDGVREAMLKDILLGHERRKDYIYDGRSCELPIEEQQDGARRAKILPCI